MSEGGRHAGQLIGGKYELQKVLGAGGMGEVWAARHTSLQTQVALKFLRGSSASEPETRSRFELEARVTAQLKTRLAVQVFDYGVATDGQPFLVMELLEGESLAQRILRVKHFAPPAAVQLLAQAGRALDKAHSLGIVHRDFKPGNIFITFDEDRQEQVKVMDFGLAKIVGELETRGIATDALPDDASPSAFTRTGALLGTPAYMSPEQVSAASDIGPATDVWALGVVSYECLVGKVPFTGTRMSELFDAIRTRRFQKGSTVATLPGAFDEWFEVACASYPAKRFPNAAVAMQELSRALGLSLAPEAPFASTPSGPHSMSDVAAVTPFSSLPGPTTPRTSFTEKKTPAPGDDDDQEGSAPTLRRESATAAEPSTVNEPSRRAPWLWVLSGVGIAVVLGGVATELFGPPPSPSAVMAPARSAAAAPVAPVQVVAPPPAVVTPPPAPPAVAPPTAVAPSAPPGKTKPKRAPSPTPAAAPPPVFAPAAQPPKPAESPKPESGLTTPALGISD